MSQTPTWIATARLLRRTGFGTTGPKVDAVVKQNPSIYLDQVLSLNPDADPGALATPMPNYPELPKYPSPNAKKAEFETYNKTVDHQMLELTEWWLQRMSAVREPIHEKLTLLWHNHFATSAKKVRYATYMAAQNQKLRRMNLGQFRPLAYAMLTDSAMLSWLDGKDNVASSPNENLSREFMELFALGHGNGYSEADVKEGARALTGWSSDPAGASALRMADHDVGAKTVLGVSGYLDASSFCDAVLAHPSSPSYIASRLWRQLASDAAPSPETLQRLVDAYGTNGDLKALTKAILLDPEFASGTSTTMPIEWLVGVARTLGLDLTAKEAVYAADGILIGLGQRPFFPPDVAGWPHGRAWVSTASIPTQVWAARGLSEHGDLSLVEGAASVDRIDAVGYLLGVGRWSDRTSGSLKAYTDDPQSLFTAAVNTPEYLTS
jgi:uncharacterized protein (DUF1800 family)